MRHHWTVEEIHPTDRNGLIAWARDTCHGLDIQVASEAMNVEPTADAIVGALTDSLPKGIRGEIAGVCLEALEQR